METPSEDFENTNAKKRKVDTFDTFYAELVCEVDREIESFEIADINVENDIDVANKNDKTLLLKKVKDYSSSINSDNRNIIVKYINFRRILYSLKTLYWRKCEDCSKDQTSDCMSCKRCISISDSKGFFEDVRRYYDYSNAHINFVIVIGRLGLQFQNFKYITFSINKIKPHITSLKKKMLLDIDFWNRNMGTNDDVTN